MVHETPPGEAGDTGKHTTRLTDLYSKGEGDVIFEEKNPILELLPSAIKVKGMPPPGAAHKRGKRKATPPLYSVFLAAVY